MPTPTPAQLLAITAPAGPVLVVAGPGAGKTFCLIERAHHLITTLGLDPERLCAVTFTNKAATEIRTRLADRLGDQSDRITGSTLHALCAQILRERGESVGVEKGFGIADDAYQREVLKRLRVPPKRLGQLLNLFGQARYQSFALSDGDEKLLSRYEAVLHERRLLDFDQLVGKTAELFRRSPVAAEEVAERWDALLVDEFQDLDRKQYAVLKALAQGHRNIFAVGDDEQSIFSWRGAEPAVLQLFKRDFGVEEIVLDRNLRCAKPIFEAARRLIQTNPALFDKRIEAERTSAYKVTAAEFADETEEAGWIVRNILTDRAASGLALGEYAVLFRQHRHANVLESAMLHAGLPCRFARGRALKDDPIIGYVIGALKLALDPDDPALVTLFAESQLPKKLLNRVRTAGDEGDLLAQLRAFAETQGKDADTKRAWRFIFHVENLAAAVKAHANLPALVDELLSLHIGSWENRLEKESERLLDPPDDPAAVALADRLAAAEDAGEWIGVQAMQDREVPLASMLSRAKVRRVTGNVAQGFRLSAADAGADGLAVTLFRALQLRETRHLGEAFRRYVTFDLETTGTDTATCEIVEVGAVRVVDGEITERYESLVRPDGPVGYHATKVHGITAADLAEERRFPQVWPEFRAFVGDDLLVAHNARQFDLPILQRMARDLPGGAGLRAFDTLPLARAVSTGSAKLSELASAFGIDPGTSHRAPDDALTLAKVFPRLEAARLARSRKSALVNLLDDLALAMALDPAPRTEHAELFFEMGRYSALGPHSRCLEQFAETRDAEPAIEALGGRKLMERLRRDRSADDRYPEAMERLRPFLEVPGGTIREQVQTFLETVALSGSTEGDLDPHAVNLLTLHATKGLEFSRVYIVGVEDGNLPGYRAVKDDNEAEIQEGRRLLYVGMTRAKDRLVLTRVASRGGYASGGSRYLEEMGIEPHAHAP